MSCMGVLPVVVDEVKYLSHFSFYTVKVLHQISTDLCGALSCLIHCTLTSDV